MLQQTQVDRTVPKFLEFMARFPTLTALAGSPAADVIRLWSGMGYNVRAVRLHRLAQLVVSEHEGHLPSGAQELRALPGIGPYTASAVACFANGASEPVLDTNVYRVLSRLAYGVEAPSRGALEPLAAELLPGPGDPLDASAWHQGLMDIGATICMAAKPRCMLCPLRDNCAAAPALQDGASRSLAESSVPYAPKQGRFEGSRRYYRGRVIEGLRGAASISVDDLGLLVYENYAEDDQERLGVLIDGLVKDGLAQWIDGRVALP
jgi:A/G-specific adenine glycosylase